MSDKKTYAVRIPFMVATAVTVHVEAEDEYEARELAHESAHGSTAVAEFDPDLVDHDGITVYEVSS